ncbi:MAG: acyltransferase [Candidatus Omnitrophota bacterium]
MLNRIILKIKNRENKVFSIIYWLGKAIINFSFPCIRPLHKTLWCVRKTRLSLWRWLLKSFYYTPMFISSCCSVGKNLILLDGIPEINGFLKIVVGNNVTIYGKNSAFGGGLRNITPVLEIGDNTFIGPNVRMGILKSISIGKHCLLAADIILNDNDGHPLEWRKRRNKEAVDDNNVRPIIIEDDVWIGRGCFICKGVKIGKGSIIGARSVVTKDVEPFTIVAGQPARLIKKIINTFNIN